MKEKIYKEKEALKKKRLEEKEREEQAEKERLLQMRPTKHVEEAGGGEPSDSKTKGRRDVVKEVIPA